MQVQPNGSKQHLVLNLTWLTQQRLNLQFTSQMEPKRLNLLQDIKGS